MNLENALQAFCTALEHEREGLWEAPWAVFRASEGCGIGQPENVAVRGPNAKTPSPRRRLFGAFATVGACTITRVRQLCLVGGAFPNPENVRQEKSHTWHRAVAQRAHALGMEVEALADLAIQEGWGQREIRAYGKPVTARMTVRLRAQCGACGAVVRVRLRGAPDYCGLEVPCPICMADTREDCIEGMWRDLGRLELE